MRKLFIGLTGGIGSGKSTALNALKDLGFKTLSCDEITAYLYTKKKVLKRIKKAFPNAVKGKFKLTIDREELSKALKEDSDYKTLCGITVPLILGEALYRASKLLYRYNVVLETPLLFENKLEWAFDKIIVITRDKKSRIESVKKRSFLSEEQILTRIDRQIDYDNFDFSKYIVVKNDGAKESLSNGLQDAIKQILDGNK